MLSGNALRFMISYFLCKCENSNYVLHIIKHPFVLSFTMKTCRFMRTTYFQRLYMYLPKIPLLTLWSLSRNFLNWRFDNWTEKRLVILSMIPRKELKKCSCYFLMELKGPIRAVTQQWRKAGPCYLVSSKRARGVTNYRHFGLWKATNRYLKGKIDNCWVCGIF